MTLESIQSVLEEWMEGTSFFVVDIRISPDNEVVIEFDSLKEDVSIDDCVALSRHFESRFDRETADYSLEVGSAGVGRPFKVYKQYLKHIGDNVQVVTKDGNKWEGVLQSVDETAFEIEVRACKLKGSLKQTLEPEKRCFRFNEVKKVNELINIE